LVTGEGAGFGDAMRRTLQVFESVLFCTFYARRPWHAPLGPAFGCPNPFPTDLSGLGLAGSSTQVQAHRGENNSHWMTGWLDTT
jgi:hypothetical protein